MRNKIGFRPLVKEEMLFYDISNLALVVTSVRGADPYVQ